MTWKEWFFHNFDKILLFLVWLVCLRFVWKLMTMPAIPPETVAWAREAAGTVLGAILGVITGAAIGRRGGADDQQKP